MLEANKKTASGIKNRYYFKPMKEVFEEWARKIGPIAALDSLTEVMQEAKPKVEKIILERRDSGHIRDIDQTRKSVAGNGFQGL